MTGYVSVFVSMGVCVRDGVCILGLCVSEAVFVFVSVYELVFVFFTFV